MLRIQHSWARVSETYPKEIRTVYVRRWQLVKTETEKLPKDRQDVYLLLDNLDREIRAIKPKWRKTMITKRAGLMRLLMSENRVSVS
jgi:hypothetical protein